jgi:hypothetical protein
MTAQEGRVLRSFALVALAGELATLRRYTPANRLW